MYNINFLKPIVLTKSLDDMEGEHKEQALRLLNNKDYIIIDQDGINIVPESKAKSAKIYFYGSEAVCIYRETLGLPDVGIHKIDVNDIVQSVKDYECLFDIMFFLHRVYNRSSRFSKLAAMLAPIIILENEYRVLREYVEFLQDNNWCDHPYICSYDIEDEDGNPEHCDDVRQSLCDVGYDLVTGECYAVKKKV